ncbi:unnamed protein product [Leuciscus chuanchicus]
MQGEPTGSKEVKKFQLLDSVDEKTIRDLRLTTYTTAEEVFQVLENRFGNKTTIALEIVEELQRLQAVKGNQPRRIVELIQSVEKALVDLNELGKTGAIKNPLVTKTIESKLPDGLKKEWLLHVAGKGDEAEEDKRFDYLLKFLQGQEAIYEKLDQLREEEPKPKSEPRQARTRTSTQLSNQAQGCVVCGDGKHKKRLYFCQKFRTLKLSEKRDAVRKLGACKKCLEIHNEGDYCKSEFLYRRPDCIEQRAAEHHYYLCPRAGTSKGNVIQRSNNNSKVGEKWRNAFCNTIARTSLVSNQPSLLAENGIVEWPVIMMLLEVTANAGQKVGTLIDLASDTNYITHDAADRLNLRSEAITLVVHGVGGMKVQVTTKRYLLKIRVRTEQGNFRSHQLLCYGLDSIADIHKHVTAKRLQKFFPDVPQNEPVRPRQIQLLISHKEGRLVPQKIRTVGDLVLWDGPLGKTIAGTHPGLFEEATVTAHQSRVHFARSMRTAALMYEEHICAKPTIKSSYSAITTRDFIEWWRWDSIGAPCTPKCGGCRCGSCQPGGKEMTLAEERELEVVKGGLTYVGADDHSDSPHWHARYPWLMDPSTLPNNRKAVEATFLRTERQLAKEPQWKKAYGAQVHEMVDRRAAKKLTKEDLTNWNGPVWYISHLIAPNPHSVTTPVRLVWNSSQKYKGQSLNDLLMKGPDVLNPIRAVLLKFRQGSFAALGDVRKIYNSVWLEEREVHLHRFLWRDSEGDELEKYAITRVNIGDKPAGCIAQLAMRETANLPQFSHLTDECQNVELILKAGGFALKPWVFSGQSKGEREKASPNIVVLPNQLKEEDNKALGLGYIVDEDMLHVMVRVNFSRRKKKMRLGQDLLLEEVRAQTPDPLTIRELLSQVAGLYDTVGLTTPSKQKGAILVRRAFQEAKPKCSMVKDTWDLPLSDELRKDAIGIFEAAKKFTSATKSIETPKWEAIPTKGVITATERQEAIRDIYLAAQEGVTFPATTTDRLVVYKEPESGLLVCGGRIHGFREDGAAVPLLPFNAWVSTLLAREAHDEGHEGVAATLLKMRRKAWVIQGRKIAQKVVENCLFCKKSRARRCKQVMADLPPERATPAAPFEFTTVDLFGPFLVKDDIKKRVSMKVWGVIFSCMASRAIHADLVNTMSTESFLMAYQRFTAIRGHPRKIWSDPGTNFIGAKPVLRELYQFLDAQNRTSIEEMSAKKGTKWEWTIHPADSPHRNGAAEAAVRILKKALQSLGNNTGLSYSEFQTTLQLAANLAIECPIDARVQSHEESVQYVSPNTLLLGRASPSGEIRTFDFANYPYKRLREMQNQVKKFWRSWSQLAGPNLFLRSKWHTSHRNVAVRDIVWLCDQNAMRGQFKLGRVVSVNPDAKGIVRDVNVTVVQSSCLPVTKPALNRPLAKVLKEATQTTVLHRDVRRLVVLLPVEDQTRS